MGKTMAHANQLVAGVMPVSRLAFHELGHHSLQLVQNRGRRRRELHNNWLVNSASRIRKCLTLPSCALSILGRIRKLRHRGVRATTCTKQHNVPPTVSAAVGVALHDDWVQLALQLYPVVR